MVFGSYNDGIAIQATDTPASLNMVSGTVIVVDLTDPDARYVGHLHEDGDDI